MTAHPQTKVEERFPTIGAGQKSVRNVQRILAYTATGGEATFRVRLKCGLGVNRLVIGAAQLFANVSR